MSERMTDERLADLSNQTENIMLVPLVEELLQALKEECEHTKELEAQIKTLLDLLRSAHSIAIREGQVTNWEAFKNEVFSALKQGNEDE